MDIGEEHLCRNCWAFFDEPDKDGPDEPDVNWRSPYICPECGSEDFEEVDATLLLEYAKHLLAIEPPSWKNAALAAQIIDAVLDGYI